MVQAKLVLHDILTRIADRFRALFTYRIGIIRVAVQLASLIILSGSALGLARLWFPLPVTYPTGAPYAIFWDGFEALQYVLAMGSIPFLVIGIFFLVSLLTGRMTCGWICPFGFFQDILSWFPVKKFRPVKDDNSFGNGFKYAILIFFVTAALVIGIVRKSGNELLIAGFKTEVPYALFDPSATLFSTFYYYIAWGVYPSNGDIFDAISAAGTNTIIRVIIFLLVMLLAVKIPRFYCRYLCPTGALLALFSDRSIIGIVKNTTKCKAECNICDNVCPMQVELAELRAPYLEDRSCINCGKCIDACPEGALSFGFRL